MSLYTFCLPCFFGKIKKSSWNKEEKTTPTMTAGVEKTKINEKFNHTSGPTMKSPVPMLPNSVPLTRSYM